MELLRNRWLPLVLVVVLALLLALLVILNAQIINAVASGGKRGRARRGFQARNPKSVLVLDVHCLLRKKERLLPVTTVRSGYRIDKLSLALVKNGC